MNPPIFKIVKKLDQLILQFNFTIKFLKINILNQKDFFSQKMLEIKTKAFDINKTIRKSKVQNLFKINKIRKYVKLHPYLSAIKKNEVKIKICQFFKDKYFYF